MEASLRGDHLPSPRLDLLEVTQGHYQVDPDIEVGLKRDPMDPLVLEPMVAVYPNRRCAGTVCTRGAERVRRIVDDDERALVSFPDEATGLVDEAVPDGWDGEIRSGCLVR